jgi:peroxiredoxin
MRASFFKLTLFLFFLLTITLSTRGSEKTSPAPDFSAEDLSGKKTELKKVLEKGPVLISFWATWCKPCIKELTELQKVYKNYREKGFEILAVDVDGPRSVSKVRSMVKGLKWDFPVLWDKSKDIYRKYQVLGIPHTVLIDKSGDIVYTHTTYRPGDEEVIKKKIEQLLEKQNDASEEKEGKESEK